MKLNSFDSIAPYYDRLASIVFGSSIRKAQTCYLNQIPAEAKVLVIGGGTGWWLKELQKLNPQCTIWFIEASKKMLDKAMRNSKGNIIPIHGSENDVPSFKFDVVITYFFLDMFNGPEMKRVISCIDGSLKKEGLWLISDFVDDKLWHRFFLFLMYRFFWLLGAIQNMKLIDWRLILDDHNFKWTQQTSFFGRFITSAIYKKT